MEITDIFILFSILCLLYFIVLYITYKDESKFHRTYGIKNSKSSIDYYSYNKTDSSSDD